MNDLGDNYAKAYGQRAGFGRKPALVMIDFVQGYFDPQCDLYADVDDTLASALRVREAAHRAGVPVILTNVEYHSSALDGGRFFEKAKPLRYFIKGGAMGAWPKGLTPREANLFDMDAKYADVVSEAEVIAQLNTLG